MLQVLLKKKKIKKTRAMHKVFCMKIYTVDEYNKKKKHVQFHKALLAEHDIYLYTLIVNMSLKTYIYEDRMTTLFLL